MKEDSRQEKGPDQALNIVREDIKNYLTNLDALLDKNQLNPLFLDEEKIISSFKKIKFSAWAANSNHVSSEKIVNLLQNYHEIALTNIYNSAHYSYTFDDERHEKYRKAALEFAVTIIVPPIKIVRSWLSGISQENRELEFTQICKDYNFVLTEDEIKQIRKEFFSENPKKIQPLPNDPHLQVFEKFMKQMEIEASSDRKDSLETAGNNLRNGLDLFFEALTEDYLDPDKYLLKLSDLFCNFREEEFFLAECMGAKPEEINLIFNEYRKKILLILGNTFKRYYSASHNKSDFISELDLVKKDHLEICITTANYLKIGNKECLLKLVEFFKEDERKDILIASQKIFGLNEDELLDIRRKTKIVW